LILILILHPTVFCNEWGKMQTQWQNASVIYSFHNLGLPNAFHKNTGFLLRRLVFINKTDFVMLSILKNQSLYFEAPCHGVVTIDIFCFLHHFSIFNPLKQKQNLDAWGAKFRPEEIMHPKLSSIGIFTFNQYLRHIFPGRNIQIHLAPPPTGFRKAADSIVQVYSLRSLDKLINICRLVQIIKFGYFPFLG
jgi:hypothetical protein